MPIFILVAAILTQAPSIAVRPGIITGQIRSPDGAPAGGIRVAAMAATSSGADAVQALARITQTEASGNYALEDVPPGAYYVIAGALDAPSYYPGVIDDRAAVRVELVSGGLLAGINFSLATPPPVEVRGRVIRRDLTGAAGPSRVRLTGPSGRTAEVQSDGSFVFSNVPPGVYEASLMPGPLTRMQAVRVDARRAATVEIELVVNPESVPDTAELMQLLLSASVEDQAWGMWLAGKYGARAAAPRILELLQNALDSPGGSSAVVLYAADALIQLDAALPAETARPLYQLQPVPALILLEKSGRADDPFLLDLIGSEHDLPWFAAANLALRHKPPGLVRSLLGDVQFTARVSVCDRGRTCSGDRGSGGMKFSDGFRVTVAQFPPVARYTLAPDSGTLLAPGPVPVYYRRTVDPPNDVQGLGRRVALPEPPSAADRLHYAAAAAPAVPAPPQDVQRFSIQWSTSEAFDAELTRIRKDIESQYASWIAALTAAGALTPAEVEQLKTPQLNFVFTDERSDRSPALPPQE